MQNLGMKEVEGVRIGKLIEMDIDAENEDRAREIAENACTQLLANEVMEDFEVTINKN